MIYLCTIKSSYDTEHYFYVDDNTYYNVDIRPGNYYSYYIINYDENFNCSVSMSEPFQYKLPEKLNIYDKLHHLISSKEMYDFLVSRKNEYILNNI